MAGDLDRTFCDLTFVFLQVSIALKNVDFDRFRFPPFLEGRRGDLEPNARRKYSYQLNSGEKFNDC